MIKYFVHNCYDMYSSFPCSSKFKLSTWIRVSRHVENTGILLCKDRREIVTQYKKQQQLGTIHSCISRWTVQMFSHLFCSLRRMENKINVNCDVFELKWWANARRDTTTIRVWGELIPAASGRRRGFMVKNNHVSHSRLSFRSSVKSPSDY